MSSRWRTRSRPRPTRLRACWAPPAGCAESFPVRFGLRRPHDASGHRRDRRSGPAMRTCRPFAGCRTSTSWHVWAVRSNVRVGSRRASIPAVYPTIEELTASDDRPDLSIIAGPTTCIHRRQRRASTRAWRCSARSRWPTTPGPPWRWRSMPAVRGVPTRSATHSGTAPRSRRFGRTLEGGVLGEPWLVEISEYNAQFHPKLGKPLNWKGDPPRRPPGPCSSTAHTRSTSSTGLSGPSRRSRRTCRVSCRALDSMTSRPCSSAVVGLVTGLFVASVGRSRVRSPAFASGSTVRRASSR